MRFVSLVVLSVVLLPAVGAFGQDAQTPAAASASPPYEVKEGNKVDPATLMGWKTGRASRCGAQGSAAMGRHRKAWSDRR